MTREQIEALGPAFTSFLRHFEKYFTFPKSVEHFRQYTRGLLTDLARKTVEPLALDAGVPPRTLQLFLKSSVWDYQGLTEAVQRHLLRAVPEIPGGSVGTVAIVDETSAVKKGTKTPGVQRQYLGCVGKVDNGINTVHLVVSRGSFKALLDSELFLPRSWEKDRERCREADIPDAIHYRPKWAIALELLGRAESQGWQFDWVTFDEGYGNKPGFLAVLNAAQQQYVGEVPKTFPCRPRHYPIVMSVQSLFSRRSEKKRPPHTFYLEQQTGPPTVWQAKAVRVEGGGLGPSYQVLIWARNRETNEVKYFLARTRTRLGIRPILEAAMTRWNVEHVFRVTKSEMGLTHFEGRSYVSLQRHLTLCLVAMAFVALQTMQLREKKSGGDPGASLPSLVRVCRRYLSQHRSTSEIQCLGDVLAYHQKRNAAARLSRRKRKLAKRVAL
jgi:SRSO17 transposase